MKEIDNDDDDMNDNLIDRNSKLYNDNNCFGGFELLDEKVNFNDKKLIMRYTNELMADFTITSIKSKKQMVLHLKK